MTAGSKQNLPKIGITIGDINGVGPEIIIKSFSEDNFLNRCTPIIYGSAHSMIFHKKLLGSRNFNFNVIEDASQAVPKKVNLINAWEEEIKITVGEANTTSGKAAYQALKAAMKDVKDGHIEILVTAPIHKKSTQKGGMDYPGHTEFLAGELDTDQQLMILAGENMKVAVVTGHISLESVADEISKKKVLKAIKALNKSLIEDFQVTRPRIAVLGLNPHAGEEGAMGDDEQESIVPALEEAERQGILAHGPYPADGFFGTRMYKEFDAVLAMYHDQGLVPFKLLEFETGVNYTAGLPIIRTSPDHGTAFKIAGKGQADEQSFTAAVHLALNIKRNRAVHQEITENPLQTKIERQKDRNA